jgi:hypothetical protein
MRLEWLGWMFASDSAGCNKMKISAMIDHCLLLNPFPDQTKYSMSCIEMYDCMNINSVKLITPLARAKHDAKRENMYVFSDTSAFQHMALFG